MTTTSRSNLSPEIKERKRQTQLKYYYANKEACAARSRDWYRRNVEKNLWRNANRRAKTAKIEFDIEVSDLIIPKFCPIFPWIELKVSENGGGINSPSLDRIDSTKGYVKGNIQIISHKANRMKNNGSLKELVAIGKWAKNVLSQSGESDSN